MKIIEIKNLTYAYDKDEDNVLKNLSLDIEEGSWVSIIGHNGSGKSTLAKLLIGLLGEYSGEIKVGGIVLSPKTINSIRQKISVVFQNPDNQFVGATVKDDVAFGLENQQIPREKMLELISRYLKEVNMEGFEKKAPHNLSGGQKQRVAIAGALAMNTDIIIFDEATSMLDPKGTKEVLEYIKKLKNTNKTIITITHNLEEARLADEIVVLNHGEVVLSGKSNDVFKEEKILKEAGLDILEVMKLQSMVKADAKLKDNKELGDALCKLAQEI